MKWRIRYRQIPSEILRLLQFKSGNFHAVHALVEVLRGDKWHEVGYLEFPQTEWAEFRTLMEPEIEIIDDFNAVEIEEGVG